MSDNVDIRFPALAAKTIVVHTVTYFIMGMIAMNVLHYAEVFATPALASYMRQTTDPIVMAGPLFQPIRGLVFALVFYPLREVFFARRHGWLLLWWTLVGLGILSTFGPASGSLEGMVFTTVPIASQLSGLTEVVPQAFLLSLILWYWVRNPKKRWIGWTLWSVFVILMLLVILGLTVGGQARVQ